MAAKKKKIGMTADEFIEVIGKKGEFDLSEIVGLNKEKFFETIKKSSSATELAKRLEDEGINDFAIGMAVCEINHYIRARERELKEKVGGILESLMEQAGKKKEEAAVKKLSYIE